MIQQQLRSSGKRALWLGVVLSVGASLAAAPPHMASAQSAANPYPAGTSTYWAWQNRPDLPTSLGEAKDWARNAAGLGWPVTPYPRPYSIAVYPPGVLGADPTSGHVAVVKQVFDDGSYLATQMDESDCQGSAANCGKVNTRTMPVAPGVLFIHYVKDTRTTWSFGGGASGWTPLGMDQGSMQGRGWSYTLTGGEAQLQSPQLDVALDSYDAVEVDLALDRTVSDPTVSVSFATTGQAQFVKGGSARTAADGAVHTVHISLGANPAWSGSLSALELRPAGPGSVGTVRIERIRLVQEDGGTGHEYQQLTNPGSDSTVYRCRCTGGARYN